MNPEKPNNSEGEEAIILPFPQEMVEKTDQHENRDTIGDVVDMHVIEPDTDSTERLEAKRRHPSAGESNKPD